MLEGKCIYFHSRITAWRLLEVIRTSGWNMVLRAMKEPQSATAPAARYFKVHDSREDTLLMIHILAVVREGGNGTSLSENVK